jgi:VWFA-related protein
VSASWQASALGALALVASPASPHAAARQSQAPPVFRVQVETVYVDAFVTHRGEVVRGLSAADFELKDNGVAQRLELVSAEALPLLAVLTFDTSGSVAGKRLLALRAAGQAFLDSLRAQDEVALFAFADEVAWLAQPTKDKMRVRDALGRLLTGGGTSLHDALYAALTLPVTQARTLVVLFTDGEDNLSFLDWRQLQLVAERSNALIHVVGLLPRGEEPPEAKTIDGMLRGAGPGSGADGPLRGVEFEHTFALRQIAEATGGRYWPAESPERLKGAFTAVAEAMGQRYVLRYEPQNVKRQGWHKIELRLRRHKGEVHARRGYWVADQ